MTRLGKLVLGVKDTLVVQEFLNIFLNSLLGLALEKEVKFNIKSAPSTRLVSKIPYKMAPTELQELKKQL